MQDVFSIQPVKSERRRPGKGLQAAFHEYSRPYVTAKNIMAFYIAFAVFYYSSYSPWWWFDPAPSLAAQWMPVRAPYWVATSRDFIWIAFCLWIALVVKRQGDQSWKQLFRPDYPNTQYARMVGIFKGGYVFFLLVALTHLFHKSTLEVFQHDLRNTMMYVLILFFLPLLRINNYDVKKYTDLLLKLGVIVGSWGIITALFLRPLTYGGRAISTFGNPNNLGFFMNLLIFLLLPKLLMDSDTRKIWWAAYLIYFLCLIYTASLSSLMVFIVGTTMLIMLASGTKKKGLAVLSSHFIILTIITAIFFQMGLSPIFKNKVMSAFVEVGRYSTTVYEYIGRQKNPNLTSISGRIDAINNAKSYLKDSKTTTMDILFGDYSLKIYKTYDNQYLNLFYNNGLLVALMIFGIFTAVAIVGLKKYAVLVRNKNFSAAAILLGLSVFMLLTTLMTFNFSAFLNRFPLNFILYFICGLILTITPATDIRQRS